MKSPFFEYYPPTDAEYARLWKEGLIVLDTNVLLNLYRLPTTARDELIAVLDLLKDRLWIPHQVVLEFQRRRLSVIAAERKSTEDALSVASDLVSELRRKVDALQIDKRGLGVEAKALLEDLEKANAKLIEAIHVVHKSQLDISSSDPVREKLDVLFDGKVGKGPMSQKELDALVEHGEDRFKDKIPPGFADADKDKNPNEATFIHNHLKYHRKFGDLILWRQLIAYVKEANIKCVLLVTADRKEDWWWREQGKTIGPHPELVREIVREGSVEHYWMYSSVQFVEHANKYVEAAVSSQSVDELKQVAIAPQSGSVVLWDHESVDSSNMSRAYEIIDKYQDASRPDLGILQGAVKSWLLQIGESVTANPHGFPDLLAMDGEDAHGFEVKYARNFKNMLFSPHIVNSLLRGYLETSEGRLAQFTLVLVISESDFFEIENSKRTGVLIQRLERLLEKYPVSGVVVGGYIRDRFEPLASKRRTPPGKS